EGPFADGVYGGHAIKVGDSWIGGQVIETRRDTHISKQCPCSTALRPAIDLVICDWRSAAVGLLPGEMNAAAIRDGRDYRRSRQRRFNRIKCGDDSPAT